MKKRDNIFKVKHPYYCEVTNYYLPLNRQKDIRIYMSFKDFLNVWEDADNDYNFIFRWDVDTMYNSYIYGDVESDKKVLTIFIFLQRKGYYISCICKINENEKEEIKKYLKSKAEYMVKMWNPLLEKVGV